jgi:hypothetical protein
MESNMSESKQLDNILGYVFRRIKWSILYVFRIFNVKDGTDIDGTVTAINKGIEVKGYNL